MTLGDELSRRRRHGISDAERRLIRAHYRSHPLMKQKELQLWALDRFRRQISQSTISETLSAKWDYIDKVMPGMRAATRERKSTCQWPKLEEMLFEWHMLLEAQKVSVKSTMIAGAAKILWERIPEYSDLTTPAFGNSFVAGYKGRHGIKQYKQHGEAASFQPSETSEAVMEELRAEINSYHRRDVYNMDETALFWKLMPDTTLATCPQTGKKRVKNRVSLALCSNADGSDKLDPWVIGKAANPRCLGRNKTHLQGLNVCWRHNQKAWMTTVIMLEFLRWFVIKMRGRKVLLLLDNFSAHNAAVELLQQAKGLENVRYVPYTVVWPDDSCRDGVDDDGAPIQAGYQ